MRSRKHLSEGSRLAALVCVAAGLALAWRLSRRFSRFAVSGESMAPAIRAGDWLLAHTHAHSQRLPRPGEVVLATHPRDAQRTLVKRVRHIDREGRVWLEGDNTAASTDSRDFGPVDPAALYGRVVLRYWPRPRVVRGQRPTANGYFGPV